MMSMSKGYKVLLHEQTYTCVGVYLDQLLYGNARAGGYLRRVLNDHEIDRKNVEFFLELLVNTKRPQIFAESAVAGDGSDWNTTELSLLGDINIAVPVTIFDDGRHVCPKVHQDPFKGTLLYVPGALLQNGKGNIAADFAAVTIDGKIDFPRFLALYERRILPALAYANAMAGSNGTKAFITVPGLGCGCFAGRFRGVLGKILKEALVEIVSRNIASLRNVTAIYFDPYNECENDRIEIEHLSFLVRPLTLGNTEKPQLCLPEQYEDTSGEFVDIELFSVVAWDHVSWPGNDFYVGSRATDDGVKAAATNSMAVMTGLAGQYNAVSNTYDPSEGYSVWGNVVTQKKLKISVQDNIWIYP
jgi:hypothetical protein